MDNPRVAVSIPSFGTVKLIKRAVESVLAQTHKNLSVFVVNDGDLEAPWDALSSITDRRLVRVDLSENRGPYFCTALVHLAADADFILIQDSDDWSDPTRVAELLQLAEQSGKGACTSAQYVHGAKDTDCPELRDFSDRLEAPVDDRFVDRGRHHGLFRSSLIEDVGGYYGGFRVGYDGFLMNAFFLLNEIAYTVKPLYHRQKRPDSITMNSQTGFGTAYRTAIGAELRSMYLRMARVRSLARYEFVEAISALASERVNAVDQAALYEVSGSIRQELTSGGTRSRSGILRFQVPPDSGFSLDA